GPHADPALAPGARGHALRAWRDRLRGLRLRAWRRIFPRGQEELTVFLLPPLLGAELEANAEAPHTPLADLANIPRQPCPRLSLDRFLHCAYRSAPDPLRPRRARPPPPARPPLQRDRAPHRHLDGSADRRCLPGGLGATLPRPRPRPYLWSCVPAT